MPDLANMFDKAKQKLSRHSDTEREGIDKGKDAVNDKTDDRFGGTVDKGADKLDDMTENTDESDERRE